MKQLTRARRRYVREHRGKNAVTTGHRVTYRIVWTETEDGHPFRIKFKNLVKCPHCRPNVPTGMGMLEISG